MRPWVPLACVFALAACPPRGEEAKPPEFDLETLESPERDAWAQPDAVVAALPIDREDMHIADIGAGSGYFTRRIARRVPAGLVYAVDVDGQFKQFIEHQRESWGTPNIEPRLALYENPLLPVNSLDGVFMSNTYPYVENREVYFRGVHDSLRPGGWLVVVDFRKDASCEGVDSCPAPEDRVASGDVEAELARAGFALAAREDFLKHQYFLVFRRDGDAPASEAPSAEPPADE